MSDETRLVHLADDDEAVRRSVGFMLKTSGFQVRAYDSGMELLKAAATLEVGCILLDIRMPGMDGLEVHAGAQGQRRHPPGDHHDGARRRQPRGPGDEGRSSRLHRKAIREGECFSLAIDNGFEGLKKSAANRNRRDEAAIRSRHSQPREREVLNGLAKGLTQQDHRLRSLNQPADR